MVRLSVCRNDFSTFIDIQHNNKTRQLMTKEKHIEGSTTLQKNHQEMNTVSTQMYETPTQSVKGITNT